MTTQHTNPFPHPLMVDTDPEDSECFAVWCDNGQGSSGEIAGRICDESYAAFIVRAVNSHAALVEALEHASTYMGDDATDDSPEARETRRVIHAALGAARAALKLAREP